MLEIKIRSKQFDFVEKNKNENNEEEEGGEEK